MKQMKQARIGIGINTKKEKQTYKRNATEHAHTFTICLCHSKVSLFSEVKQVDNSDPPDFKCHPASVIKHFPI